MSFWQHHSPSCRAPCLDWSEFSNTRQQGQALTEALVVFSVLLLLWAGVAWLGRFQDMALQASHASRFAAFSAALGAPSQVETVRQSYFESPAQRWADRRGQLLLQADRSDVQLHVGRGPVLPGLAQAAQNAPNASLLREQWQVADSGIVDARVSVQFFPQPAQSQQGNGLFMSELRDFDLPYPRLTRHTAILADAGHASDDASVQVRVAASSLAWSDAANQSYELAGRISNVMSSIDAGWRRPAPNQEWLNAWAGEVPTHHRHLSGGQP